MQVRTIKQSGAASLTEYVKDGSLCRVYVPSASIVNAECDEETLERGIEYGLPWEELLEQALGVTPEMARQMAHQLRRRGVWVTTDLRHEPEQTIAALQAAFGASYQRILAAAETFDKESVT